MKPGDPEAVAHPARPPSPIHGLGAHTAERYRHFRQFVEEQEGDELDDALFGLLLSAESMRDEMRAYEEQPSKLIRLAQTGHFVRQLQHLHNVLDAVTGAYNTNEAPEMKEWKAVLEKERADRVTRYREMLASLRRDDVESDWPSLAGEVESDAQQEEVMTLLKAGINKYKDDGMTSEEVEIAEEAFELVAQRSNAVVMSLPMWLVIPLEFGSTVGLSRWGNDLLVRDNSDPESFIEEANVWSNLNHPHVAKFLGACHVGAKPFFAHEKVRPLTEYLSGLKNQKDQKQMWHRMYEVALGIQFLHERGFACAQLTIENVFCAQFEDKAVLFGVNLVETATPTSKRSGDGDGDAQSTTQPMSSDIRALGSVILDAFRAVQSASKESNDAAHRFVALGDERPSSGSEPLSPASLTEVESELVKQICEASGPSDAALYQVIEALADLAGASTTRLDYLKDVQGQVADQDGETSVDEIKVPTTGKTIGEILPDSTAYIDDGPIQGILSRLRDVRDQLQQLAGMPDNIPNAIKAITHFCALLVALSSFTAQTESSNALGGDGCMVTNKENHASPVRIHFFHRDIDRLMKTYKLSLADDVHKWMPRQVVQIPELSRVAQSTSTRLMSRVSPGSRSGQSPEENQEVALPRWFVMSEEVEFESFAAFSRGAFGSVHHGKWFDTSVVVKRAFVDDANRAAVKAQFCHEATVWFNLNHINVVKMYGACHAGDPFFVCEFASGGNVDAYLRRHNRDLYLAWYCLLNAALGIQYLHDNGVVHADLKANNILVGTDGVAKVADFGLSLQPTRESRSEGGGALGAYRWKAPECLPSGDDLGQAATFASDVYSFAMCIIEVVSGVIPWGIKICDDNLVSHVKRGELPPRPTCFQDSEWELIQRMCCLDPSERVTINTVVVHLTLLLERLDMKHLKSSVLGEEPMSPYKNLVLSRGGTILMLTDLARSSNKKLSEFAGDQLLSVHVNRGVLSEKREIEAIVAMLSGNSDAEKEWAAGALNRLSWSNNGNGADNEALIVAAGGVGPLLVLARDGSATQKVNAASALGNMMGIKTSREIIVAEGGIPLFITLLRNGSDYHRAAIVRCLGNLASDEDASMKITSAGGNELLVVFLRYGSGAQIDYTLAAISNLSMHIGCAERIKRAGAIPLLIDLAFNGNAEQTQLAARALQRLALTPDCARAIISGNGIAALMALTRDGDDDSKAEAAVALSNLALLGQEFAGIAPDECVKAIVDLVRSGNGVQKELAAMTLLNFASTPTNQEQIASLGGIEALVDLVRDGTDEARKNASGALSNLANNDANKKLIIDADGIPLLVNLAKFGNPNQQHHAVKALNILSTAESAVKMIVAAGGVEVMQALERTGGEIQRALASNVLMNMRLNVSASAAGMSNSGVDELAVMLRDGDDTEKTTAVEALYLLMSKVDTDTDTDTLLSAAVCIEPVVSLIATGNDREKELAARILVRIGCEEGNVQAMATGGGIDALVTLVRDGNDEQKEAAAWGLQNVSGNPDPAKMLVASAGAIPPLVALAQTGNSKQREHTVKALVNLSNNESVVEMIAAAGGIEMLLPIARSGDNEAATLATYVLRKLSVSTATRASVAASGAIEVFVGLLRDGNDSQKEHAAGALFNFTGNPTGDDQVVAAGGIDALVALVRGGSEDPQVRGIVALWDLSGNAACRPLIVAAGGVEVMQALERTGGEIQRALASNVLMNMRLNVSASAAGMSNSGVDELAVMLRDGDDTEKTTAVEALYLLMSKVDTDTDTDTLLSAAVCIEPVVSLIATGNDREKELAARILVRIGCEEGNVQAMATGGGIDALVTLVRDSSEDLQLRCMVALRDLSKNAACRPLIVAAGGVEVIQALERTGGEILRSPASSALMNILLNEVDGGLSGSRGAGDDFNEFNRSQVNGHGEQVVELLGSALMLPTATDSESFRSNSVFTNLEDVMVIDGDDQQEDLSTRSVVPIAFEDDRVEMVSLENGLAALLELASGNGNSESLAAAQRLQGLLGSKEHRKWFLSAGGISTLVKLMSDGDPLHVELAACCLGDMTEDEDAQLAIASTESVELLLGIVWMGTSAQRRNAIRALSNLATSTDCSIRTSAARGIPALVATMRAGTADLKASAAKALGTLATDASISRAIVAAGGIAPLAAMLRELDDDVSREEAMRAVSNIATHSESLAAMAAEGAIDSLALLLRDGTSVEKEAAAAALTGIVSGPTSLGDTPPAPVVEALIALIRGGNAEQMEVGLRGLRCVADTDEYLEAIASADGVSSLVALARDGSDHQKDHAAFVLALISTLENSVETIAAVGGVSVLAELVRSGSGERKASAALALQGLSRTLQRLAAPTAPATSWWSRLRETLASCWPWSATQR